ncbi:MAG: hypothetical protein Kow0027_19800 [Saprospiraceae bacterium]|nr:ATP synthase F0 subunit A [Saprospirales bacterium]
MRRIILTYILSVFFAASSFAQDHGTHGHDEHAGTDAGEHHTEVICGEEVDHSFDPGKTAFHHVSDQNVYSIGPLYIPLPCILYVPGEGFHTFSSGKFEPGHHASGHKAIDRFVLFEGTVRRVSDPSFPEGEVEISGFVPKVEVNEDGKEVDVVYVCYNDQLYLAEPKSTLDPGLFGGGITSFYDFSVTKNVVSMIVVFILLAWMFISVANAYKKRDGMAPKGLQSLIEPVFLFIQDEVAKPFIGNKWEQYLPFLQALFFFILGLNLFGQIPFFGNSNVTGNLAFTGVLALFTFFVVNLNGNKHYWEHIFWMPGVPAWVKVVLTPVEFLGLFIKPFTLMLRLAANISAGHIVLVVFVGLIFVFGKGQLAPSIGTAIGSTLLSMFMMSIELLVAFIQAFVFTLLTASYIGAATEEVHH